MEFLYEHNAVIRYISLPSRVKGFTIADTISGIFNIYINQNLSHSEQCKTVLHEIEHIKKGHFRNDYDQNMNDIEWGMAL